MATRESKNKPVKLTVAQERTVLEAMRAHPTPYTARSQIVPKRLTELDLFRSLGNAKGYALTRAGLDIATALSAQRIINAVNALQKPGRRLSRADGAPVNWPFPFSAYPWGSGEH